MCSYACHTVARNTLTADVYWVAAWEKTVPAKLCTLQDFLLGGGGGGGGGGK